MDNNKKLETLNDLINYLIELRDEQGLGDVRVKREVIMHNDDWITSRYEPLFSDHIILTEWNEETDVPDEEGNHLKEPSDRREIHFTAGCDWMDDYPELCGDYDDDSEFNETYEYY